MSVDVEIYMNNLIKFFRENPKDLLNLIPKNKEDEFYIKIKERAAQNFFYRFLLSPCKYSENKNGRQRLPHI